MNSSSLLHPRNRIPAVYVTTGSNDIRTLTRDTFNEKGIKSPLIVYPPDQTISAIFHSIPEQGHDLRILVLDVRYLKTDQLARYDDFTCRMVGLHQILIENTQVKWVKSGSDDVIINSSQIYNAYHSLLMQSFRALQLT